MSEPRQPFSLPSEPHSMNNNIARHTWKPTIEWFLHLERLRTCVSSCKTLRLQGGAINAVRKQITVAIRVHRSLKSISFPTKDVIAMASIASGITHRPSEWLRAIRRPHRLVVEWRSVPVRLEENLGNRNRMSGRTCSTIWIPRWIAGRVSNVTLVIWAVQIDAIPACRETNGDHNTNFARSFRKVGSRSTPRR